MAATSPTMKAFGALAHPSVFFADGSNDGSEGLFSDFTEDALGQYSVAGRQVIFFRSGYVVVYAVDKEEAESILNAIFFPIKLLKYAEMGIPYIYPSEIDKLGFDSSTGHRNHVITHTWSFRSLYTHCSSLREEMNREQFDGTRMLTRHSIYIGELEKLCALADRLLSSPHREALLSFIRAYSERGKGSWTGGFFHGFIAIEIFLFTQLSNALGDEECFNVDGDRIRTADAITKLKNVLKNGHLVFDNDDPTAFDESLLEDIDALRKTRNKIFHAEIREGGNSIRASKEEFERCFWIATQAWWRLLRLSGIQYSKYHEEFREAGARGSERMSDSTRMESQEPGT